MADHLLYVEWHFAERKNVLWVGIPSRDGTRVLYSIPLCEAFTSEWDGVKEIVPEGRFKHFVSEHQEWKVDLDAADLKERWFNREEFFYEFGRVLSWIAENCRDEPWSMSATANMMEDTVGLHFSFANHVVAIAFKFAFQ